MTLFVLPEAIAIASGTWTPDWTIEPRIRQNRSTIENFTRSRITGARRRNLSRLRRPLSVRRYRTSESTLTPMTNAISHQ